MNPTLRNIIAVVAGWIGGSIVNMGLVQTGSYLLPIEGIDPNDMDALAKVLPTLSYEYFIFPFLAHALGTLAGAVIAAWIAANRKMTFAFVIGGFFLVGGIVVNYMLPGPVWFAVLDILVAYIPMAWIGGQIALRFILKE